MARRSNRLGPAMAKRVFPRTCESYGLPIPEMEVAFAREALGRRWRFDYAWPERMVALECNGGVFTPSGGRHTHGVGYVKDLEKLSWAAALGWLVIQRIPQDLNTRETMEMLKRAFQAREIPRE